MILESKKETGLLIQYRIFFFPTRKENLVILSLEGRVMCVRNVGVVLGEVAMNVG